ncbi:MFS transporter SP family general alpha glucoside:H+ symporter [Penicillium longicatenatum]|uniref:MFS transporter SP family general alpha glucoside:H+ symporter n=1 Tax=Penicillium longicatenatum TaxID=1561947 RepID=UPI002549B023|nr:MFS transporter SP family general alpha glucoside:H+ symporter [Penicillium longicatenatum]KAJ5636684.1 MFS transporter SP family general alpha glucoside:H+ symporter [Penicillium longicatenatum]
MANKSEIDVSAADSPGESYDSITGPVKDAFKLYKKAILWYGTAGIDGTKVISAAWQSGISCGMLAGCIVGLTLNSMLAERLGYKITLIGSLVLTCGARFSLEFLWSAYSYPNIPSFYQANSTHRGVFQTLPLTHIAEVLPLCLRGYMTTSIDLCMVTGQLIAAAVVRAFSTRTDEWSYRLPLGLQWAWPLPIIIFTFFVPESPWWLVRRGRVEDAKKSLSRLTSPTCGIPIDTDREISIIQATNEQEIFLSHGAGLTDCFKRVNIRRTEIVIVAWMIQTLCGFGLVSYAVVFWPESNQ